MTIHVGDCLEVMRTLEAGSVQTCVTSPPYFGLRDYGHDGQIGLEATPDAFVGKMVEVFREVRRLLRDDGTLWLNLGDSYAGGGRGGNPVDSPHQKQATSAGTVTGLAQRPGMVPDGLKAKDLIGIPWRVAFALQADGWYLRQDIIWHKPNPMPESVRDRCTKAHEYLFLLSKGPRYHFDADAIAEPASRADTSPQSKGRGEGKTGAYAEAGRIREDFDGTRNKRSVWTVSTMPFREAHFATFPERLIEPCILAGCPVGGTVLDPFMGAGTTAVVCERLGRKWVGCELNPEYAAIADARIRAVQPGLAFGAYINPEQPPPS